jgi:hypothetical protein
MSGIAPPYLPPATPTLNLLALPNATEGVAYSSPLGYLYLNGLIQAAQWSILANGDLPAGAQVNQTTGVLNATFPTAGAISFQVRVTHLLPGVVGTTFDRVINLTVSTAASGDGGAGRSINVVMASLPNAAVGAAYATSLGSASVSGSAPPTPAWSIAAAGNLPGGYSLSNSGLLSATFPDATTYTFVVRISAVGAAPVEKGISLLAVASGGSGGTPTPPPAPPPAPPPPPPPEFATTQSNESGKWLVERFVTDDGQGYLQITQNGTGTVDYAAGELYFPPELLFVTRKWSSAQTNGTGTWGEESISDQFANGAQIRVTYTPDGVAPDTASQNLAALPLEFTLLPYTSDFIVPGTVRFTIGGTVYEDFEGVIQHTVNPSTGIGVVAGTINYGNSRVVLTDWVSGSSAFSIQSVATFRGQFIDTEFDFRTISAPLRPGGFQVAATALDGDLLTGSANIGGIIEGAAMDGTIDVEYGRVRIRFGALVLDSGLTPEEKAEEWYDAADVDVDGYIWKPRKIIPQTGRYNGVIYSYLPIPADKLGLNPVRLPMDGRVPTVRVGDAAILHYTDTLALPNPIIAGSEHDLGQTNLARVWLKDAADITVAGDKYTADLDTGILTFVLDLDLTAYTQPLTAYFMIADEGLVVDTDVSGLVTFGRSIIHDYPLGSYLSTHVYVGDLGARITVPFAQLSWTSVWSDTRIGNAPQSATFAHNLYPITVTNDGAVQERWRIQFVSSTTANVIGETLGQLNFGPLSILVEIAPTNPVTGQPYFTIPEEGWGAGWVAGNLIRFNTLAADYPVTALRCVSSGPATGQSDRIGLEFLGDVDA